MRVLAVPPNRLVLFKRNKNALLREIEARGKVSLSVDEEGNVSIEEKGGGAAEGGGEGSEWIAEQVVKAIALGFEPKQAFKLFRDDYFLEVLDLELLLKRSRKLLERQKARIIGVGGKVKKTLHELTGAWIAVSDNKVALLGEFEDLKLARQAILRILDGREITSVYGFLERKQKNQKMFLR